MKCQTRREKATEFSEPGYHLVKHDPAVTLLCEFNWKTDEDLYYDITWYIDEQEVLNQTVDASNNYTAVLTAYDVLGADKKIGTNVVCKVGAKRDKEKVPCLFKDSDLFFYGIKVCNPSIELERKGSKDVDLEMTIPSASETRIINGVEQPASALAIYMHFHNNYQSKCSGSGSSNQCFVQVQSYNFSERHKYETEEWKRNISFPVYNKDTDGYVTSTSMTLSLRTGSTEGKGSKIFENAVLPDIPITVRDTNEIWKGRICSFRSDPHVYTFDGQYV
ncbi:uncharacterized protein LOC134282147 [Saccostrea cucullata]|uniref:uncharacterized protein LOC134282147 n=1 Tax=Saccostrea cuccullata TaxID=36930 RepID=UPI002ED52581